MKEYNQQNFINALRKKFPFGQKCSACGGSNFMVASEYVTLYMSKSPNSLTLGPHIPAGALVCNQCGHIELFSLGLLLKDEDEDGNKRN